MTQTLTIATAIQNITLCFDEFPAPGKVHKGLEKCLLFIAEKAKSSEALEQRIASLEADLQKLQEENENLKKKK